MKNSFAVVALLVFGIIAIVGIMTIIFIAFPFMNNHSKNEPNWNISEISIDEKISDHFILEDDSQLYKRFENVFNLQKDSAVFVSGDISAKCIYDEKNYDEQMKRKLRLLNISERRRSSRTILIPLDWSKKDSVTLVGQDAQLWAKIYFIDNTLDFSDTLKIYFSKNVTRQRVHLPSEMAKEHYKRVDDVLNFSMIRIADNVAYFSLITNGLTHGINSIEIVYDWQLYRFGEIFHNYVPLLKICEECTFHKVDSSHCLVSGQTNVTKEMFDFLEKHSDKKSYFGESDIKLRFSVSKENKVVENIETNDYCNE